MATLRIEESDHYKEMAFVELSKQESTSWDQKSSRCREMAVSGNLLYSPHTLAKVARQDSGRSVANLFFDFQKSES